MSGQLILLVERSSVEASTYAGYLDKAGLRVVVVETAADALQMLAVETVSLIVLDCKLPETDGVGFLTVLRERQCGLPVLILTGNASLNAAVQSMRAGAWDYLVKPFRGDRLVDAVRAALSGAQRAVVTDAQHEDDETRGFRGFIGTSAAMQAVYHSVRTAATSKATIFISGESGTGKEVCAEAIHLGSTRAHKPFVAINCAAIPKDLVESEIFGHVKGAFTGAVAHRVGAAAQAHRGTLFLDEICEMDLQLQSKLLRFLQTGTLRRVGASEDEKVDVRVICATNRDPLVEIAAGRFREDLYYRLHVVAIHLPPLRERGADVLEIARSLLADFTREEGKRFARLAPCAEAAMLAYAWPGNVRELQNVLRSAVVLNDGVELTAAALPEAIRSPAERATAEPVVPAGATAARPRAMPACEPTPDIAPIATPLAGIEPLWLVEKKTIEAAIQQCGDNIPRAAEALEISPSTIYRKRQLWTHAEQAS